MKSKNQIPSLVSKRYEKIHQWEDSRTYRIYMWFRLILKCFISLLSPFLKKSRLDEECEQLLSDIRRIGEPGEPFVLFGDLFDDDEVQNYYEALVGTLKSAKKRGKIEFKGQMLLKGAHDKVKITILEPEA